MCRWLVFIGQTETLLADLISKPKHSILTQTSKHFLPGIVCSFEQLQLLNAPINGDGFGVGWYTSHKESDGKPCVFTGISPAWSNRNLQKLCNSVKSNCVFTHIRAASPGSVISEVNCHPFQFGKYLFMHNGGIAYFSKIKRTIHNLLSPSIFEMIEGTTDTETVGALFVQNLPDHDPNKNYSSEILNEALIKMIQQVIDIIKAYVQESNSVFKPSSLNFAVTDGNTVLCSRFRNGGESTDDPPSLYYSTCSIYNMEDNSISIRERTIVPEIYKDSYFAVSGQIPSELKRSFSFEVGSNSVIIASEPLSFVESQWNLIPKNHIIVVTSKEAVMEEIYVGEKGLATRKTFVKHSKSAPLNGNKSEVIQELEKSISVPNCDVESKLSHLSANSIAISESNNVI